MITINMESKESDTVNIIVREVLPNNDGYGALQDNQGIDLDKHQSPFGNKFPKDAEFAKIVFDAELAVLSGDQPVLSSKGTSGCYFVNGRMGVCKFCTICIFHTQEQLVPYPIFSCLRQVSPSVFPL